MKAKLLSILLTGILLFFSYSCEEKKEQQTGDDPLVLTGELIDYTGCKQFKSASNDSEIPDTLSCVSYDFDALNNKLTIHHINAGFNCCPDSIYCKVSLNNDTIVIQEFEKMPQCYCECLFDLTIELNGIEAKKYCITFEEPYCGDQPKLEFYLDLETSQADMYCVIRKQYPWGQTNYEEDPPSSEISGRLISNTGCKSFESDNVKNNIPGTVSCINYVLDPTTGELLVKHVNAGFNCCPDSLYCIISVDGDTIVIEEFEKDGLCDCLCLFDLDIKLEGVIPKEYYMKVIEPYVEDEEKLYFDLDLSDSLEGTYCVTRVQYPWMD
ncbi:MAG: hypothetical protein JXB24_00850 [Bacteroidales bacterium]|nr:hypothetical protein [Bacteroidales bacterium]